MEIEHTAKLQQRCDALQEAQYNLKLVSDALDITRSGRQPLEDLLATLEKQTQQQKNQMQQQQNQMQQQQERIV